MFWIYAAALMVPPIVVHRLITLRLGEADDGFGATVVAIVVAVVQGMLLSISNALTVTMAMLVLCAALGAALYVALPCLKIKTEGGMTRWKR